MSYKRKLIVAMLLLSTRVFGMKMPQEPRPGIHFLYDNLRLQRPTRAFEGRAAYNLSGHLPVGSPWLRADLWLILAPDSIKKSRSVDIRQHYYGGFSGVSFTYVYLFRYCISMAPGVWQQVTKGEVLNETFRHSKNVGALLIRSSLDYAPSSLIELSLTLSLFRRQSLNLWDWSYGFGINFNI